MKYKRKTKRVIHITAIVIPLYIFIMLLFSSVVYDNPSLIFVNQASAEITNPFGGSSGNDSNYSEIFDQFEGFVIVASAVDVGSHDLHLYALPGQRAQIYRNFSIYIFTNQPCFYEVKVDDQVLTRGHSLWKAIVKSSSPYSEMNIEVTLINETNSSLPVFRFSGLKLLDSPWDVIDEGDGAPIVEEWIRFTQGEFTAWIIRGILLQLSFAFLGIVAGTSYASIHADLRGIQRVV